jgi:putative MATE family efflux protein
MNQTKTTKTNKKSMTLTSGPIWKEILFFFFPILIGAVFQQLYNTVDAVVVGQFAGSEALASVGGSSGQIVNFIFTFFTGLSSGASVIIAQYFGAEDEEHVNSTLHTAFAFSILGGIALGILGILFCDPMLRLLKTPDSLMKDSAIYVRILMAGLIFTLIYNMGTGILRAIGDSRRPLYILIMASLVNIVLDLLFVAGFSMGVLGAAIATVISQAFSAAAVTWLLKKKTPGMELRFREIRLHYGILIRILRIGFPTAVASSMFSISNMILQSSINSFGVNTIAAWTAYGRIDVVWWLINQAFSISITTFVGQNYGARKADRIKKASREVLFIEIIAAVVAGVIVVLTAPYLVRLFDSSPDVIRIGRIMARSIAPYYWVFCFIEILSSVLRAENDVLFSTIANLVGICAFRAVWLLIIVRNGSLGMILASYPISYFLTAAVIIIYYLIRQPKILKKMESWTE